ATPKQRQMWKASRVGLHWEEIKLDIPIADLLDWRGDMTPSPATGISATSISLDERIMSVDLTDARKLRMPLTWLSQFLGTTPEPKRVEIVRIGLRWDEIDKDIPIAALLAGRREMTSTPGAGMEQLKLLMTYTVFHIGLYSTISAALLTFLGTSARPVHVIVLLGLAIFFFLLAGVCGGLVAGNISHFTDFKTFCAERLKLWNIPILEALLLMRLEHIFFWIGVGFGLFGLGFAIFGLHAQRFFEPQPG